MKQNISKDLTTFFDLSFLKFFLVILMGPCSQYAILHKRATCQAGPETLRKPYARRRSHTYARYYVSQSMAELY